MKLGMMMVVLGMMSSGVVFAEETGVCKDGKQVTTGKIKHEFSGDVKNVPTAPASPAVKKSGQGEEKTP